MKGYSHHQDVALALCRKKYGTCPFGCTKDGAPNCHANVTGILDRQCEPGKLTEAQAQADERKSQEG